MHVVDAIQTHTYSHTNETCNEKAICTLMTRKWYDA